MWVAFGQMLSLTAVFAGIKILTNLLGPQEYGRLALGLSVFGLINMFIYGPISQVVLRFYSVYQERRKLGVYLVALRRIHAQATILFGVLIALASLITAWLAGEEWGAVVIVAAFYGLVSGIGDSFLAYYSAVRQRRVVAGYQGLGMWLRLIVAVAAVYFLGRYALWALVGYFLGTLMVVLVQGTWFTRSVASGFLHDTPRPDKVAIREGRSEFLSYASSFIAFAGFAAISMYADRWILQTYLGEADVGKYFAVYQIANAPLVLLFGIVNQLMVPIIFGRAGAGTPGPQTVASGKLLSWTVVLCVFATGFFTAALFFFEGQVVRVLTSQAFAVPKHTLWVMVLGLSLFNLAQLLVTKGLCHKTPKAYTWPKALQAIAFVILAVMLVDVMGLLGVALALCLSSLVYLLAVTETNRKLELALT